MFVCFPIRHIQFTLKCATYRSCLHITRSVADKLQRNYDYDLIVIGGGPGGLSCAREAVVQYRKKVALLDFVTPSPKETVWGLGGTCVNVGCIPKKLMHHAALLGEAIQDARAFGWKNPVQAKIKLDWPAMIKAVQEHIQSINFTARVNLRNLKIDYINGHAHFIDSHTILAKLTKGEEKTLTAENFVIAIGGRPHYPKILGAVEHCITSDDIFSLQNPPGKTLVVGAGYIGMECAGFLRGLGYEPTVMVRSVVLRSFDQQMVGMLVDEMQQRGVKFLHNCVLVKVIKMPNEKLLVHWKDTQKNTKAKAEFDTVLLAVGRKPVTESLQLHKAGVELNKNNQKIITIHEQTNIPHIYAVGDVLNERPELTPVAVKAAKRLVARIYGNSKVLMDYNNVATTVFTPLEYGCVGLSEDTAIKQHGENKIEVYHTFYKPTDYFTSQRSIKNCYLKVVCLRAQPQKVLGMHFIGPQAGEVIQGYAAAMKCGLTYEQLEDTVGIHPTVSEEFTRVVITKRSGLDPVPQSCCS